MFLPEIQQAVKNMIDNMKLTDYVYGEVTSISPLKIKIDQKLELPFSVLILTTMVVNDLEVNDKVILLRVEKGQKYIVLSKVV